MMQPHEMGMLFDWDGVIIDSSRQHEESWERLALEEGKPLPVDHFGQGFGKKNEWIIPNLLKWVREENEIHRLSLRKEALYREVVLEKGLEALPGVHTFLERLRGVGIPTCVGSSTHRLNIDTILAAMGFAGLFDDIVTAEDVTAGKPHPEVFLKAGGKIDRDPKCCIVFEDAFAGIEAARAGKIKVVGVATTHNEASLAGKVDRVVHQLDELAIDDLLRIVSS